MSLLSSIRADIKLYGNLRSPGGFRPWYYLSLWFCCPGLLLLTTQRLHHGADVIKSERGWTIVAVWLRLIAAIGRALSLPLTHSLVDEGTPMAGGIYLSNLGNIILGAQRVGRGTMIHHRVTIGRNLMNRGKPAIGENVWIGPDCVISGDIEIGDGVTLLPQTVVTRSVPAGVVLQGNPPRIVSLSFDNAGLRATANWAPDPTLLPAR